MISKASQTIDEESDRKNHEEVTTSNIVTGKQTRKQRILEVITLMPPKSFREIKHRLDAKQWYEAYQKELDSLEKVGGMTVIARPRDKVVVPLLELLVYKNDKDNKATNKL